MGKFKFRLATLLRLREATRDERRTELAQAYRADEIIQQEKQRLARDLVALKDQARRASAPGRLDLDRLLETRRHEVLLRSQEQHAEQQHEAIQAEIQRRRQAAVDANRQVRVLEQLRQRQYERHRQGENRQEVKQLDEAAGRSATEEDDE
jgi:flagellar export protein FliJ